MPIFKTRRWLPWRTLLRVGGAAFFVVVGVVLALMGFEDRFIYHPVPATKRWREPTTVEFRDIELLAEGVRVHARWFPSKASKKAVVFCHSRAGNLSLELSAADVDSWSRYLGCSILIFDYPGYGRSDGRPNESGCHAAADAAYDWVVREAGVRSENVLIYGRSLGAAVAAQLAVGRPHRALILVSPPISLPEVVQRQIPIVPASLLMRNRFECSTELDGWKGPTFIVHGTRDSLIPFDHGKRIFAALRGTRHFLTVENAKHGNCVTPEFFDELRMFLERIDATNGATATEATCKVRS